MLGILLLALALALGLALVLACCCKPKKVSQPPPSDPAAPEDPPYQLRTRPTRPALDHGIYHRY